MQRVTPLAEALATGELVIDADGIPVNIGNRSPVGHNHDDRYYQKGAPEALPNHGRLLPADYPAGLLDPALQDGTHAVWTATDAAALGLPFPVTSELYQLTIGRSRTFHLVAFASGGMIEYRRRARDLVWESAEWERTTVRDEQVAEIVQQDGATATAIRALLPEATEPPEATAKVVPLSLTRGASTVEGPSEGTVRYPIMYAPEATRWRVHVVDVNPRYGNNRTGTHTLTHVLVGPHAGGGQFAAQPATVAPSGTVPPGKDGWVSEWMDYRLGSGQDQILSFAYESTVAPVALVGGGWTGPVSAAQALAPTLTQVSSRMPFHVWIEVEAPADSLTVAALGSSSSAGVGTSNPTLESFVDQYARAVNAWPQHFTESGTRTTSWIGAERYKWTMWDETSAPDALIWNIGSNDIYGNATLPELIANSETLISLLAGRGITNLYAATIPPRASITTDQNTVRRGYNDWMRESGHFTSVFDFSAALSANDTTMLPEFDSGDSTHFNSAGHAATVAMIDAPRRPSAPAAPEQDTGAPEQDTGARLLDMRPGASGQVLVQRNADRVTLTLRGVAPEPGTFGIVVCDLPYGFRAPQDTPLLASNFNWAEVASIYVARANHNLYWVRTITDSNTRPTSPQSGTVTYRTTDPWPGTPPGTPA